MRISQAHVGQFVKVECPDKDWYSATMTPYVGRTLTIERIGPGPSIHERYAYCKETAEVPFNLGWLQSTESKPDEDWISKTLNGRRRRLVTTEQRGFSAVTQAVNTAESGRKDRYVFPISQIHDEREFYNFNDTLDFLTKIIGGYFSTTDRELRRKVCERYLTESMPVVVTTQLQKTWDEPVAPAKMVVLRGVPGKGQTMKLLGTTRDPIKLSDPFDAPSVNTHGSAVKAKDPDDCPCTGRDLFTVGHRCGREKRKR